MVRCVAIYLQGLVIRTVGKAIPRLQPDLFSAVISVRYSRGPTVVDWLLHTHQMMSQYDGCHNATVPTQAMGFLSVLGHVQDACYNPAHFSQSRSQVILISLTPDYPRLPRLQNAGRVMRRKITESERFRFRFQYHKHKGRASRSMWLSGILYNITRRSPLLEIVSS